MPKQYLTPHISNKNDSSVYIIPVGTWGRWCITTIKVL